MKLTSTLCYINAMEASSHKFLYRYFLLLTLKSIVRTPVYRNFGASRLKKAAHNSDTVVNKMGGIKSFLSASCGASVLMALYISFASMNLYRLMFPLAMLDVSSFPADDFVGPLWKPQEGKMRMRVYLSTRRKFSLTDLRSEFSESSEDSSFGSSDVALLWDEKLSSPAFSKYFLLTTTDCDTSDACEDISYKFASTWLDQAELTASESEDGLMAAITAAGQGIESTSVLLTIYQSAAAKILSLLISASILPEESGEKEIKGVEQGKLERSTVFLRKSSPIWSTLQSNSTLYVHVLVLRNPDVGAWPPSNYEEAVNTIRSASRSHSLLLGEVGMVKHDSPDHITKPRRILYHDLVYLFRRYVLGDDEVPPWDMKYSKPEEFAKHEKVSELKARGAGYPYWKPEVSIKYVNDEEVYPADLAGLSGMPIVQVPQNMDHPTGIAFTPALHVDEIGLTSEKYIPINETLTSLPLRISFDRSDMHHQATTSSTATAGGLSPARWRLLMHLSQAIEQQTQLGFEQSDIDDVRRLIAETNVTLLAITMLASALHLLFEFLTFKSEVNFWSKNEDLTGLSVRSLFLDMIGQTVILFFLIDKDSSLLMTIPSACGCLIALWKCQRAAGLRFVRTTPDRNIAWWNWLPSMVGFELRATRLESQLASMARKEKEHSAAARKQDLTALTIESDRIATRTLGTVLLPFVVGYTLYSLVFEEHLGWYSWLITSASSAVYALGFVLMTPQLFLNWKLKSVAHLPWRVLVYKSLNTFIDDLFSFIIRMPTMARISCFRDDVVFFIYLYQRWLYPVDASRPAEGGGEAVSHEIIDQGKKNQ